MSIGHTCTGGGAQISNSPINIHIHIHSGSEPLISKISRSIYAALGKRHIAIEKASSSAEHQLSREFIRAIESR